MIFTKGFSVTNFCIGSSALAFQVFVLFPWHERLDRDFEELKKEHLRVLHAGESDRKLELAGIQAQLKQMNADKKNWLWRQDN